MEIEIVTTDKARAEEAVKRSNALVKFAKGNHIYL
jgi:hypothetical protein